MPGDSFRLSLSSMSEKASSETYVFKIFLSLRPVTRFFKLLFKSSNSSPLLITVFHSSPPFAIESAVEANSITGSTKIVSSSLLEK